MIQKVYLKIEKRLEGPWMSGQYRTSLPKCRYQLVTPDFRLFSA